MKKLYLVDVSSMYFRAFYAIRPLSNKSGMPTNALYGFLSMTVKLLKQIKPDYMAFCFDTKHPSFRKDMYPEYKANRSEMPEDLVPQVPYVRKLTDALGIPAFAMNEYEADDLIGSLTCYGRDNGVEVVIVSGDKDFGQLVGPYVSMLDTMKDVQYDEQGVQDKWGVPPTQMIDYLALCGDASDNIPGVRGIGPKGAQKLLAEFSDLEEIYESLDKIKNKNLAKKLEDSKDNAFLSKQLIKIVTDLDLVAALDDLKMREVERGDLQDLLEELDFNSFAKNLLGATAKKSDDDKKSNSKPSAVDPDAGLSVSSKVAEPLPEEDIDKAGLAELAQKNKELWGAWTERGLFFSDEKNAYVFRGSPQEAGEALHGAKTKWRSGDVKEFANALKLESPQADWDQKIAAYVVEAGSVGEFDALFEKYVGGRAAELPTPGQLFVQHFALKDQLEARLKKREVGGVYRELELPLVSVLVDMESQGILIDRKELEEQRVGLAEDIQKTEKTIHELAGEVFNVASTKQLAKILFEKMGIDPIKKTKTGYSTDNEVLEKLADEHEIAEHMIEYRELSKLKSTYVDALGQLIHPETGRIYTHFNQVLTATGRLSSHDPNLQNIPIRTPRGSRVRRAFVAEKGKTLLSVDYSQIELRVLAHITDDPGLVEAFENDHDIHAATASHIFQTKLEDVTADQRRSAKAVNFGIAYGQGPFGLAETLGITRKEASEIIAQYFNRFAKVREYMDATVEEGKQKGYVETIFGRRRYLPELANKNGRIRKFGERAAINAPIQGTASDLVKMAMIACHDADVPGMLLQVHDELLFEIEKSEIEEQQARVKDIMEGICKLKVPLKVNCATGDDWESAHS